MTISQEDALYDFLETATKPFTPEDVVAYIRAGKQHHQKTGRLAMEIALFIDSRNIAFRLDTRTWISRRGCFETVRFVIQPSRMELLNGILIPGHRCIPFANPVHFPQEYRFYWKGAPIAVTTIEGSPEEFYPYYSIYGEEYAPQYVARDNPENEAAFNGDPYDDPPEVSIQVLDMRNIYRESAFVPGDRFVARTLNWKEGTFELQRVDKDEWSPAELQQWCEAAEQGFYRSFERLGPGNSTEEQIAYAYWYGGERMRAVPAYSLEDFLYEQTERIETAAYGIETRFWYAGKEIPDRKNLTENQNLPDQSRIEDFLYQKKIPVSEYVVLSYMRDALFRNDLDISRLIERIVPPVLGMTEREWHFLAGYMVDAFEEFKDTYSLFTDTVMGPIRQRVGELHTAVIDLTARLQKGDMDASWLPKHTFTILSQIQGHAAGVLEDLCTDEAPPAVELEAMDNSLDSMIETYEDIKELIDEALNSFRRNNLSVVKFRPADAQEGRIIQAGIGGTEVWRRMVIPEIHRLEDLHRILQTIFGWHGIYTFRFLSNALPVPKTVSYHLTLYGGTKAEKKPTVQEAGGMDLSVTVEELSAQGITELSYEYGTNWTVKIIILSRLDMAPHEPIRCIAGAGAAPPDSIDGPVRFRKYLTMLERGSFAERQQALHVLGQDFDPETFDREACNRSLNHE
ncbi:MAG: plasmid pRiA4b ORF-3 family protein [Treponema sp.]|jgi:hypothetical protein|nr:plasmid pRiA4b ORF-3 family protein [Treponema sp.]